MRIEMETNKFNILIIEDSKLNQELLRRILEKEYDLAFVQNGEEALENVKTDDLNPEQKKLLSDLIKQEMMKKIEDTINNDEINFADHIKSYLRSADEEIK